MSGEKCEKLIFSNWHHYPCSNKAKVKREGKWYCGKHDPVAVEDKHKNSQDKWDREWAEKQRRWRREKRANTAIEMKAAIYDKYRKQIKTMIRSEK
jgi:hypothetical protein